MHRRRTERHAGSNGAGSRATRPGGAARRAGAAIAVALLVLALLRLGSTSALAAAGVPTGPPTGSNGPSTNPPPGAWFDRIFVVWFENKDRSEVLQNPYFAALAKRGEILQNYYGVAHPSQPNYIALIGGNTFVHDNGVHNISARNLTDSLEASGYTWKSYQEGLPRPCYAQKKSGNSDAGFYVRTHNPFISFNDIREDPVRCARIVNADLLPGDVASGTLPTFSFFAPNKNHDAHDQPLADAARWLRGFLEPKLADPRFTARTLIVVSFDEGADKDQDPKTQPLYTVLLGPMITPGTSDPTRYDHYSVLRTIESTLGLPSLGQRDRTATPIQH